MYGDGQSELLVGEAIKPYKREDLFLVSKVYPWNAGGSKLKNACEQSLARLGTDYLDLYLLHWRGSIPLAETVAGLEELKASGLIKAWGVSNFDLADMEELWQLPDGQNCAVVQNLYHLASRGIDYSLRPWLKEKGIPVMAYCPLAQAASLQGSLLKSPAVNELADKYQVSPFQIILAFVLHQEMMIAIPKASSEKHVQLNRQAADLDLTAEDLALLERDFPKPTRKLPLDIQ